MSQGTGSKQKKLMAIAIAYKDPISFPWKAGKILIAKLYMQSLQENYFAIVGKANKHHILPHTKIFIEKFSQKHFKRFPNYLRNKLW